MIEKIQNAYETTPGSSKVRTLFGIDSVHGAVYVEGATIFPQQINVAATFNPDFAEQMGTITAKDTRFAGMSPYVSHRALTLQLDFEHFLKLTLSR